MHAGAEQWRRRLMVGRDEVGRGAMQGRAGRTPMRTVSLVPRRRRACFVALCCATWVNGITEDQKVQ